ncbi:MAG: hypothetical protein RSB80_00380 [Anaerovoracaceae bacterium]
MIQHIDTVYYPYIRFRYSVAVGKSVWSKLTKLSDCIIDLVTGTAAEGRGIPDFEEKMIDEQDALGICVSKDQCYKIGHDFTLKLYLNKAKLLHTPKLEIIEEDRFYKMFYVVQCKDNDDLYYYVMVDGIEGNISILDEKKDEN